MNNVENKFHDDVKEENFYVKMYTHSNDDDYKSFTFMALLNTFSFWKLLEFLTITIKWQNQWTNTSSCIYTTMYNLAQNHLVYYTHYKYHHIQLDITQIVTPTEGCNDHFWGC